MKKFISALLVLTVLFCFTACKPESDPTPTPAVDLTTLDGMYVVTYNTCGKPCNQETVVISGDKATWYSLTAGYSIASFNTATQEIFDGPNTIVRNGLSFYEVGCEDDVYTLEVQNGVGLLTKSNSTTVYQKVLPGEVGESLLDMNVYLSGDGAEGCNSVSIATMEAGQYSFTEIMLFSGTNQEMYFGDTREGVNENEFTVTGEDDDENDFSFTVTVNGNTATVSDVTGIVPSPAGTYTKYVRTTPWPTVSAN